MSKKIVMRLVFILAALVAAIILTLGIYVVYMQLQYYRIEDKLALETENAQTQKLSADGKYSVVTYNIGFGAYNHDFSFFMDSGTMNDGTPVSGKMSRAQSAEIVNDNTNGAISVLQNADADFYFLQETDRDSTRSHHIDQTRLVRDAFADYSYLFAQNFHSAFLAYPFHEMHGFVNSGIVTLSRFASDSAVRRSYPVDNSFFTKFFDLDRCFSVEYLPIEGTDVHLVLINSHMSAYDEGGIIRAQQLNMLFDTANEALADGNYVIIGGDFNHVLGNSADSFESQQLTPAWVAKLSDEDIPSGFSIVHASNETKTATCRSTDLPYTKGVNYTAILDGFIISDNIIATAENIDAGFDFSDHNPVKLTFEFAEETVNN